jgi:hypothetical protein
MRPLSNIASWVIVSLALVPAGAGCVAGSEDGSVGDHGEATVAAVEAWDVPGGYGAPDTAAICAVVMPGDPWFDYCEALYGGYGGYGGYSGYGGYGYGGFGGAVLGGPLFTSGVGFGHGFGWGDREHGCGGHGDHHHEGDGHWGGQFGGSWGEGHFGAGGECHVGENGHPWVPGGSPGGGLGGSTFGHAWGGGGHAGGHGPR